MKKKKCGEKKKCTKKMCAHKIPKTKEEPKSITDQVFAMISKWFNND